MPLTNLEKVCECLEVVDKGVFNDWEQGFLSDMERRLQTGVIPSPKRQRKIDELYDTACKSPY